MFQTLKKIKELDSYKKRGIIYSSIAVLFLGHEVLIREPTRMTVVLLWLGVIIIAVSVMVSLKEPER